MFLVQGTVVKQDNFSMMGLWPSSYGSLIQGLVVQGVLEQLGGQV